MKKMLKTTKLAVLAVQKLVVIVVNAEQLHVLHEHDNRGEQFQPLMIRHGS